MWLQIYQVVLMSLMFIFSLISFSFMIASLSRYLKNKKLRELDDEKNKLIAKIDSLNDQLAKTSDVSQVSALSDDIARSKAQLKVLQDKI